MIAVIDYGMGNVASVWNALRAVGADVQITQKPEEIEIASHLVLPGVGAFSEGMKNLGRLGLGNFLAKQVVEKKKPFLGICLGMQLLAEKGFEFGENPGLGWIPGNVIRLNSGDLPLPHVGWNNLSIENDTPLLRGIPADIDFYFVHSYHFSTKQAQDNTATCDYGEKFTAVISHGNIHGVQFHPEKSQRAGKALLKNFLSVA